MTSQTARARPQVERVGAARREVHGEARAGVDGRDDRGALHAAVDAPSPGRTLRALSPAGSRSASRMSPARIATRTARAGRRHAERHFELGGRCR